MNLYKSMNLYKKRINLSNNQLIFFKKFIFSFLVLTLIAICFYNAFGRIVLLNFVPINGDFQNYNGFRRLLAGQIPFKDFIFYLGLGPLYVNSIFIAFHNTFAGSLFVTNFLTSLMFFVAIFILFYLTTKNKYMSIYLTLFYKFSLTMQSYFYPGHSLRMQRLFVVFVLAGIMIIVSKFNNTSFFNRYIKNSYIRKTGITGFAAGMFFLWSNDFGISSYISLFSVCLLWLVSRKNNIELLKALCIFIVSSCFSWFVFVNVLTHGNFIIWLKTTMNIAQYQFWYYGISLKDKTLYFTQLNLNFTVFVLFGFIIYYTVRILRKNASYFDAALLFIILSTIFGGYIYQIRSGNTELFEASNIVVTVLITAYLFKLLEYLFNKSTLIKLIKNKINIIVVISHTLLCITIILLSLQEINYSFYSKVNYSKDLDKYADSIYIKELDGKLPQYGSSLQKAKKIIDNKDLFSTYASALEVMTNQYQPTGIDYIIHVLGDKTREEYINNFSKNNYTYVSTIREDFSYWEQWVKRANWFFYRQLYLNYRPSFTTDYNVIWEKSSLSNLLSVNTKIDLIKINNASYEIKIETPNNQKSCIADVKITYKSGWTSNRIKVFAINRIVSVSDDASNYFDGKMKNYFLPPQADEYYIPIRIENGIGKITITSNPIECSYLDIKTAKISNLFNEEKLLLPGISAPLRK